MNAGSKQLLQHYAGSIRVTHAYSAALVERLASGEQLDPGEVKQLRHSCRDFRDRHPDAIRVLEGLVDVSS